MERLQGHVLAIKRPKYVGPPKHTCKLELSKQMLLFGKLRYLLKITMFPSQWQPTEKFCTARGWPLGDPQSYVGQPNLRFSWILKALVKSPCPLHSWTTEGGHWMAPKNICRPNHQWIILQFQIGHANVKYMIQQTLWLGQDADLN